MTLPTYITADEAAEIMRITPQNLATRRSRGTSPPYIKDGGRVMYRRADVTSYLDSMIVGQQGDEPADNGESPYEGTRLLLPLRPGTWGHVRSLLAYADAAGIPDDTSLCYDPVGDEDGPNISLTILRRESSARAWAQEEGGDRSDG